MTELSCRTRPVAQRWGFTDCSFFVSWIHGGLWQTVKQCEKHQKWVCKNRCVVTSPPKVPQVFVVKLICSQPGLSSCSNSSCFRGADGDTANGMKSESCCQLVKTWRWSGHRRGFPSHHPLQKTKRFLENNDTYYLLNKHPATTIRTTTKKPSKIRILQLL